MTGEMAYIMTGEMFKLLSWLQVLSMYHNGSETEWSSHQLCCLLSQYLGRVCLMCGSTI